MLRDDINNALKDAMKAGDARRVSTLRLVNSSLKNADIEARGQGKPPLSDEDALGVLQKMIKQRQESAELYQKGGRPELAAQEQAEIAIISGYLPQQLSDIEAGSIIQAIVHEINAQTMKDMGRVMATLRPIDRLEIQVLVDNATDGLSSTPSNVESEFNFAARRGLRSSSGRCLCCAVHGRAAAGSAGGRAENLYGHCASDGAGLFSRAR